MDSPTEGRKAIAIFLTEEEIFLIKKSCIYYRLHVDSKISFGMDSDESKLFHQSTVLFNLIMRFV